MEHAISIDKPFEDFRRHLEDLPKNDRIIFSGKYGIGKSYFLREFFEEKENSKKYFPLFINPVNYSSAQTHDIIQLIKFDIFYQLLKKNKIEFDNDDSIQANWLLYDAFVKNYQQLIPTLLVLIQSTAPEYLVATKVLEKVYIFYEKIKEKVKKAKDGQNKSTEDAKLNKFINSILNNHQSPYEEDFLTSLIQVSINLLRENDKKVTVLIIDDLDRLDPEQMFRILNVISAYNNYTNQENRFGVDKIVLVCDIDNVKATYKHRYGDKADFDGFMDKFYTYEVFKFRNILAVKEYIKLISNGVSPEGVLLLKWILHYFLVNEKLNIRQLRKATINLPFNGDEILFRTSYDNLIKPISEKSALSNAVNKVNNYNFLSADEIHVSARNVELIYIFQVIKNAIGEEGHLYNILDDLMDTDRAVVIGDSIHMLDVFVKARVLENNDYNLFFSINNLRQMDYPVGVILNWKFGIKLKWNVNNKYDGSESYYDGADVGYEGNIYANVAVSKLISLIKTNFERINNRN